MSEEKAQVRPADMSMSMLKRIKRMNHNELVAAVIQLTNYAEQQKAANMILMGAMEELKKNMVAQKESEAGQNKPEGVEHV